MSTSANQITLTNNLDWSTHLLTTGNLWDYAYLSRAVTKFQFSQNLSETNMRLKGQGIASNLSNISAIYHSFSVIDSNDLSNIISDMSRESTNLSTDVSSLSTVAANEYLTNSDYFSTHSSRYSEVSAANSTRDSVISQALSTYSHVQSSEWRVVSHELSTHISSHNQNQDNSFTSLSNDMRTDSHNLSNFISNDVSFQRLFSSQSENLSNQILNAVTTDVSTSTADLSIQVSNEFLANSNELSTHSLDLINLVTNQKAKDDLLSQELSTLISVNDSHESSVSNILRDDSRADSNEFSTLSMNLFNDMTNQNSNSAEQSRTISTFSSAAIVYSNEISKELVDDNTAQGVSTNQFLQNTDSFTGQKTLIESALETNTPGTTASTNEVSNLYIASGESLNLGRFWRLKVTNDTFSIQFNKDPMNANSSWQTVPLVRNSSLDNGSDHTVNSYGSGTYGSAVRHWLNNNITNENKAVLRQAVHVGVNNFVMTSTNNTAFYDEILDNANDQSAVTVRQGGATVSTWANPIDFYGTEVYNNNAKVVGSFALIRRDLNLTADDANGFGEFTVQVGSGTSRPFYYFEKTLV